MNYFLRILVVLFFLLTNKTYSQITDVQISEKSSFVVYSNENITATQLNLYKSAVNDFSNLDELRFLDERRIILFEKDGVSVELLSANELSNKYGKEIPENTILPGSKYLPVRFQLINWENGYAVHPIFDKFNELTY
ncbi:MAG: hypothetical protein FJX99_00070 [Bacteroidetes bacterium]|nr:hypothetical protein [Bacteroidota bacterium]